MVKTDPWLALPQETVDINGVKVEVRGLTAGELEELTKDSKLSPTAVTRALICACCTRVDGVQITPEYLTRCKPLVSRTLSDAIARVNGLHAGNSSATDGEGSDLD